VSKTLRSKIKNPGARKKNWVRIEKSVDRRNVFFAVLERNPSEKVSEGFLRAGAGNSKEKQDRTISKATRTLLDLYSACVRVGAPRPEVWKKDPPRSP